MNHSFANHKIIKSLGDGGMGHILQVQHQETNETFVMKMVYL